MQLKLPDGKVIEFSFLKVVSGIFVLILILFGGSMFYQVNAEEESVLLRFGKHIKTVGPGLHFKLPYPIDVSYKVPTRLVDVQEFGYRGKSERGQNIYKEESSMLTGDLNIVQAGFDIQFSREDPSDYLFNVNNPVETLRDISQSVMREIMGDRASIPILTIGRAEIQVRARELIQAYADRFKMGIRINEVNLIFVNPPDEVREAFNDLNKAEQDAVRFVEEASREYQTRVPRSRGQAERMVLEAEGFKERRIRTARGDAERFTSMLETYRLSPEVTQQRLYLEAMESYIPRLDEVILVDESMKGILPLLELKGDK